MTTSITVGAICTDVAARVTRQLDHLLLRSHGSGVRHLPARAAMQLAPARQGRSQMALMAFTNLLESASGATGMEHLGLHMAELDLAGDDTLLRRLAAHAPTLGQALRDMARFFPLVQTGTSFTLSCAGGAAELSYRILDPSIGHSLQDAEFTMARLCKYLRETAGASWHLDEVALPGETPRGAQVYRDFFRGPVRFGAAASSLRFSASVLELPFASSDPQRYTQLCEGLERELNDQDEAALLEHALGAWILCAPRRSGTVSLEDAAGDFGISVRTLQRRLEALGIHFSALRARVRMEAACRWLTDSDLPVSRISEELGFSETSAFTRAFRSHTAQSPRAFRRTALAG